MIESIFIKNFKKIRNAGATLSNFWKVNYLVGENGCGKSSVLSAISFINDAWNARPFFSQNSVVKINGDWDKSFELIWQDKSINPNNMSSINDWLTVKMIVPWWLPWFGRNGGLTYSENEHLRIDSISQLEFFNTTLRYRWFETLDVQKIVEDKDPFSSDIGRTIIKEWDIEIELTYLSDWIKSILKLRHVITLSSEGSTWVVIIEEPENNLNPKFHKKIPWFVELISSELVNRGFSDIQFFIATHSPFIISAAAELPGHKVYLVENGQTRDLEWNLWLWQEWYLWYECKKVVNEMLGVWFDDFQNKIVVCEWDPE